MSLVKIPKNLNSSSKLIYTRVEVWILWHKKYHFIVRIFTVFLKMLWTWNMRRKNKKNKEKGKTPALEICLACRIFCVISMRWRKCQYSIQQLINKNQLRTKDKSMLQILIPIFTIQPHQNSETSAASIYLRKWAPIVWLKF